MKSKKALKMLGAAIIAAATFSNCFTALIGMGSTALAANTLAADSQINNWSNRGISTDIAGANNGYITVSQTFTAPVDFERVRLNVSLFRDSTMSVVQYVDNFRFTVADEGGNEDEKSDNMLIDGDFEMVDADGADRLADTNTNNLLEYFTTNAYGYYSKDKASHGKSLYKIYESGSRCRRSMD